MASFYVENIEKNVVGDYLQVTFRAYLKDVDGAEEEIKERLVGKQIYYGRLSELIRRLHERYPGVRKEKSTVEVVRKVIKQLKKKWD